MGKQLCDLTGPLRGQPLQYVPEVLVGIVPVELGRLDQAGDGGRPLARLQRSREQPVLAPRRPGAYLLLVVVVVDGQACIAQVISREWTEISPQERQSRCSGGSPQ